MKHFFEELFEEITDFFEDFTEHIFEPQKITAEKEIKIASGLSPAYYFAERIENLLKVVIGSSIIVSAVLSSVWGFVTVSDLVQFMVNSLIGRSILALIGSSYFIVGIWKLMHLKK